MALKDLLVVVDDSDASEVTFDFAAALAADHGAHLAVLCPVPSLPPAMTMGIEYSTDWLLSIGERIRASAEACRARIGARAESRGVPIEWRSEEGDPVRVATEFSRYVDLTVMTQGGSGRAGEDIRELSDYFILDTGRPVVQVPFIGAPASPPRRVVVGWDGSRSATRALHDALPLLTRADHVELLSIREAGHDDTGDVSAIDISAHLARHDVNVETRVLVTEDIEPADSLLSHVSSTGADLVVIGAYGHSRLRELVLGGMTRGILRQMTVPVLLSY